MFSLLFRYRFVFVSLLGFLLLAALFFRFGTDSGAKTGRLEVETFPAGAVLFVDQDRVGQTPWQGELAAGWHEVKLEYSDLLGHNRTAQASKIETASGCTSLIYRDLISVGEFYQSYQLSCADRSQKALTPLLSLFTSQSGVEVRLDKGQPLTLPQSFINLTPRSYWLNFKEEGFNDLLLRVTINPRFHQVLQVELARSIIKKPRRIGEELTIEALPKSDGVKKPQIVNYQDWYGQMPWKGFDQEAGGSVGWKKVRLYTLMDQKTAEKLLPKLSSRDLLKAIVFQLNKEGLTYFPFAYALDQKGIIYEGLSLKNFDFSSLADYWQKQDKILGVVPVLYLSGGSATSAAQKSLEELSLLLSLDKASQEELNKEMVEVLNTPTGYLNVRSAPSQQSDLIGTVYPGEKYPLKKSEQGWVQIGLRDGSTGYIYALYTRRLSQ